MTISKNFDGQHSCAEASAECEHAFRIRIADSHILTSSLPRFTALAAIPLAEAGQLYPDEDTPRDV